MSEWSYTEQLLHTLDEFETPDGFRVKHLENSPKPMLGCWRISLGPFRQDEPKSRFNLWLMMFSTGWVLSETPSVNGRGGALPRWDDPEPALTKAKELLRAREAAQRLGAT